MICSGNEGTRKGELGFCPIMVYRRMLPMGVTSPGIFSGFRFGSVLVCAQPMGRMFTELLELVGLEGDSNFFRG